MNSWTCTWRLTCQIWKDVETKNQSTTRAGLKKKKIRDNDIEKRRSMDDGTDTQISSVPIFENLLMLKIQGWARNRMLTSEDSLLSAARPRLTEKVLFNPMGSAHFIITLLAFSYKYLIQIRVSKFLTRTV